MTGPPALLWDDAIPEADRFDVFNDASRSLWHRLPATRGVFECDAADYLVDDVIVYHLRYDEHAIIRTPAQVATGLSDGISVQLYRRGSIKGAVGGFDLYAAPDRIVLQDLAHPFSVWTEDSEVIGVIVPRARIADHLDDLGLDVDTLRRQFFCSRATLYRLFEADGGVARFIREARLRACMHDLALPSTNRKHIGLIATRWGFENPSHFNRLFKQAFGVVPSAVGGLTLAASERPRTRYHTETLNSWVRQLTPRESL